ncbi:hypothetical protein V6B08_02890 [Ferrovibrio sp. MS7]|uniref:hypothetical protein n=1 Tax=Ferrovibrio plantarum TaxID=3119164 RepID=UPI003135B88A
MIYIVGFIYFLLALLVGVVGTGSRIGFFGTFMLSLLLTPLLMIFLLIALTPRKPKSTA